MHRATSHVETTTDRAVPGYRRGVRRKPVNRAGAA
jgi:hypothetical protein